MTSPLAVPPVLLGSRRPRILSLPSTASSSSGDECADLAAEAGLFLDPWQRDVLVGAMGERPDGKWAARDVGLVVPRQNGKNAILEARELAGLFLLNEETIIHTAHQYKTAHEAFLRIRSLIDNHDSFRKRVKSVLASPGKAEIIMLSGQRLMFVARGVNGSVRGFSPDFVILDEAYRLPSDVLSAIKPAISVRPNPQVWHTSSAGFVDSEVLARLRARGVSGASRTLAYFEWSAPDGTAVTDRAGWAQANPGYGIRLFDEAIESELESMDEPSFARERLGIWEDTENLSGISSVLWSGLAAPGETQQAGAHFGLATAPDRSWTALAAAWFRSDGIPQLSVVRYDRGTAWVEDEASKLRPRPVVDVASRGLVRDVHEVSQQDQAKAHNALADAVAAGQVRHDDVTELNVSVRASQWRPLGDTRLLDRKGSADISPLVAAALALYSLREHKPRGRVINLAEVMATLETPVEV